MKVLFFYISILATIITSCNSQKNIQDETTITTSDTSNYSILRFQEAPNFPFDSSLKETSLSKSDLDLAFILFSKSLNDYNLSHTKHPIDIYKSNYKLQLIAATNADNEKIIWVNGFCYENHFSSWRNTIVWVRDGGQCFFDVTLNLTKKTFSEIGTNGRA